VESFARAVGSRREAAPTVLKNEKDYENDGRLLAGAENERTVHPRRKRVPRVAANQDVRIEASAAAKVRRSGR
jgi:hypothetical protein